MPIYEYRCEPCLLQVEKLWGRASTATPTLACPECGCEMPKMVSASNFAFSHPSSQLNGSNPPNTGTSDDFNFDKAIGRDAAEKWKTIDTRNSAKDAVISDERKNGLLVKRDQLVHGSQGYRKISEPERVRANENRAAAQKIAVEASKR